MNPATEVCWPHRSRHFIVLVCYVQCWELRMADDDDGSPDMDMPALERCCLSSSPLKDCLCRSRDFRAYVLDTVSVVEIVGVAAGGEKKRVIIKARAGF